MELVAQALFESEQDYHPGRIWTDLDYDDKWVWRRNAETAVRALRLAGWQKVGPDQVVVPIEPAYIQCQACGAITVDNGDS